MKVLLAQCRQEVSTFNPAISTSADLVMNRGPELIEHFRPLRIELGGAIAVLEAAGADLVPAFSAMAISSAGPLAADSWDAIRTEFLDTVRAAGPVDAAFFAMHGAMCAENEIDPEGALLVGAREILGPNTSIVVSLDLHGIVTDRMLESVDAAVAYHTYPHNDFYETGARGAELLLRIARGEVRPVMAMVRIPALVRGDELITESGLIGARIRECQALEASGQALAAAMFWGNPFTDVPDLCSNSLVVTDNDPVGAEAAARDLAARFWVDRAAMQAPLVSLEEAVRIASETEGTTILVDAADATSSGASGDSNAVLRALIEFGYKGSSLHPIVDAPAVSEAMHAGIGNTIEITIGGTVDPERFTPLPVRATVRMLSDGRHTNESHNTETYGGRTAVLEIGHHTVIATSRAVSLYDRSLFLAHGQDPTRFDVVVQKSPHCQHRFFADWATRLVGVDAPGSTSANLPYLGHTRCARPMYPMELDTEFHPEANLFHA